METDYRAIMSALVAGNRSWNQIRADLGVSKSTIDKASRVVRDHLSTQDLLECGVGSHSHECGTHLVNQARVGPCSNQPQRCYLPGLAMRQLSRIHVGNSKTAVRDAYVIAHAGLNLPDSLRSVDRVEEVFLQLKVLNGIDED